MTTKQKFFLGDRVISKEESVNGKVIEVNTEWKLIVVEFFSAEKIPFHWATTLLEKI